MQVLVKNPHGTTLKKKDLVASFWSDQFFFMGPMFSMSSLMSLSDPLGLSPFLVLDARVAFLVFQLAPGKSLYAKKMGSLGVIASYLFSNSNITHDEDRKKVDRYVKEYLPEPLNLAEETYDQVIVYNETEVDPELWNKLKPGGVYIYGSCQVPMKINPPTPFEVVKKTWTVGKATESGWRFDDEKFGLKDFEFYKLKKLS